LARSAVFQKINPKANGPGGPAFIMRALKARHNQRSMSPPTSLLFRAFGASEIIIAVTQTVGLGYYSPRLWRLIHDARLE
jgi:hypothetical protein